MKFFTFSEMGAADAPEAIRQNVYRLCTELLDPLREGIGMPIRVNSGYRTPEHNRRVGGVANSDHLRGLAADIRFGDLPGARMGALLREVIAREGLLFDQLIVYPTFVHISYRPEETNRGQVILK